MIGWLRDRWFDLTRVHMTLHEEPTWQRHAWVPRWRVKAYLRGGWCRWPT